MGLFKKDATAGPVQIMGNWFKCQVCSHDNFYQREGKVQTTALTFFDLEWLNASANCVVCARCGFVHWFLPTE